MVAGVKGVAFLDGDTMAVTSSTKGELFLVSKASQSVLRRVELDVKAESLCAVPGTRVPVRGARRPGRHRGGAGHAGGVRGIAASRQAVASKQRQRGG